MDALHILDCVLLEKGQAIETDDNALLFRVQFDLDTGVIYFFEVVFDVLYINFLIRFIFYHINRGREG